MNVDFCQLHIGQQLGFVNTQELFDTLQFDDQLVLDQNVNSVSTVEPNVFVLHRLRKLKLKGNSVTQHRGTRTRTRSHPPRRFAFVGSAE